MGNQERSTIIPEQLPPLPLSELTAITTIDGRHADITVPLRQYFSEYALIRGGIAIEIKYLEALSEIGIVRPLSVDERETLENIWQNFTEEDAKEVKQIERTTRHDVKSREYFLKGKVAKHDMQDIVQMVHLGLTSEDPTNLTQNILIREAKDTIIVPSGWRLVDDIVEKATEWKDSQTMLGRTHGKEAAGTKISKELALFGLRLAKKLRKLEDIQLTGKLNGVIGNFHELTAAYPDKDWISFSKEFIESLGLEPLLFTTQIEPHDRWAELLNATSETATVVESLDENVWLYGSQDYLYLPPREGQIGSSTMPHKGRNPIDLENSEGNSIMSRGNSQLLAVELPKSRLQRHLSDSTLARNIGLVFGFTLIAFEKARSDIHDFTLLENNMASDIDNRWGTVTSGIQSRLRAIGVENPYEQLDALAKSAPITRERLHAYIDGLSVSEREKTYLKNFTPGTYIGKAEELTDMMLDEIQQLKTR